MDKHSFLALAAKVADGVATPEELALYNQYFAHFQHLQNEEWNEQNLDKVDRELRMRIHHHIGLSSKVVPFYRRRWIQVAAAILIVVLGGATVFFKSTEKGTNQLAKNRPITAPVAPMILPGSNKATLTLASGATFVLENATNGELAREENIKIIKLNNGQLAYQGKEGSVTPQVTAKNTLTTPSGGQYQLILPDGTRVWLNAASSLEFPTAFTGKERRVALKGEAYFEVAKNADMPFHVEVNDMEVSVLGTHFNIMAYPDEKLVKTTLLEGSVKVKKGNSMALLSPGQQAQLAANGLLKVVNDAQLDEVMAWKNGLFYFDGADVQTIMRQMARWYNLDVEYQGKFDQHFTGKINRNLDALTAFKLFALTDELDFHFEGKKVVVSSK